MLQIFGRAARPQYHDKGHAVLMCTIDVFPKYVGELLLQNDIESSFKDFMVDSLNAEISTGNITKVTEAVEWIKHTFFYIRLLANPRAYDFKPEYHVIHIAFV